MNAKLRRDLARGARSLDDPTRHPFKSHAMNPTWCDTCGLPVAAHGKPAHRDNLPPLHVPEAPAVVLTNYPAPCVKLDSESSFRFFLTPDQYIDVSVVRWGARPVLDLRGETSLVVRPQVSNVIHVEVEQRGT